MMNLPKGMIPDRDNVVYYDTEIKAFYIIEWRDRGNGDVPIRHYIIPGECQNFTNVENKKDD